MGISTRWMRHLALVAAVAIGLAGCGGVVDTEAAAESPTPSEATTITVTQTPTATEATPEQVASVIAGQESDWRETIDGAGECRILNTIGEGPADELQLTTCYLGELTMGVSASHAIRGLNSLDVPGSMSGLVEETIGVLQAVADIDLEGACGPAFSTPADTQECSDALGSRFVHYGLLGTTLDKWRPYL